MESNSEIWKSINKQIDLYNSLGISDAIDHDKFYLYSIIAHSTAIEGSTLSELDTQLLLDEGITAKGKPLVHHLMNTNLKAAYDFAMSSAKKKTPVTPVFLKELNSLVMKSTGSKVSVSAGTFDSSQGDFRLCSVTAGFGGDSYMNYLKVPQYTEAFCKKLNERLKSVESIEDIYNLSFDAHLNLVTIHPWVDGNGRTSRLLMNYIQYCKDVIPTKVYQEDKAEYIQSLIDSRKEESNIPFRDFMARQLLKMLEEQRENYKKSQNKGFSIML